MENTPIQEQINRWTRARTAFFSLIGIGFFMAVITSFGTTTTNDAVYCGMNEGCDEECMCCIDTSHSEDLNRDDDDCDGSAAGGDDDCDYGTTGNVHEEECDNYCPDDEEVDDYDRIIDNIRFEALDEAQECLDSLRANDEDTTEADAECVLHELEEYQEAGWPIDFLDIFVNRRARLSMLPYNAIGTSESEINTLLYRYYLTEATNQFQLTLHMFDSSARNAFGERSTYYFHRANALLYAGVILVAL